MQLWRSAAGGSTRALTRALAGGCCCALAMFGAFAGAAPEVASRAATNMGNQTDLEQGLPLIQTFSPAVFDSPATPVGSQMFDITRGTDGALLVANNDGLLRLDGTGWRTWNPIRGAILSVATRADGRVFVGGVDDIGYFDRFGRDFVSLRAWSKKLQQPFGEFWVVLAGRQLTHFVDRERAYRWDGHQLELVYEAKGETREGALIAGAAVILDPAAGLVLLEPSPARLIKGSEILVAASDCALGASGALLASLCGDGVLRLWTPSGISRSLPLHAELSKQLAAARPSALAALESGGYAVATRRGGLFLLDADGRLAGRLSQLSGLDNVRTFSLLATGAEGLWLGRDHGLAMIEWPGQVSRFDLDTGLPRIPLGVGRLNGHLHAVTSAGVYRLRPGDNGFSRAEPHALIGNVLFDVTPTPEGLFIPARDGLYALDADGTKRLDPRLCYTAMFIDGSPPRLIVGGERGAWVMERAADGWHVAGDVPGIDSEVRRIAADGDSTVWIASRSARQLFRVHWKLAANEPWQPDRATVEDYSNAAELLPGPVTPLSLPDGIAFATSKGLFRFDPTHRKFVADKTLNALLPIGNGEIRAAFSLDKDRVIVVQHDRYLVLVRSGRGWIEQTSPLGRIPRGAGPRSAYRDPDGTLWITTSDAVYRHQPALQSTLPALPPPRVELERDRVSEPVPGDGPPLRLGVAPMQLSFRYSSAVYVGADQLRFRSRLLPMETEWSEWSDRTARELGYVHGGDFLFEVQARDIFGRISRPTLIRLHLDLPWYQRLEAYLLYALAALLVIALIVQRRERRLKYRARELEDMVRERTQALEKASVTDQLTGLHNRHYFDIASRDLLALGDRTLVALIDLDHFKQINDSRGHDVGDQVLMAVASRLVDAAPAGAVLFRWGGEEFLLLAPLQEDGVDPETIADKILHRVGDAPIAIPAGAAIWMTCSIGWEIAPRGDGPSIHAALRQADLNLYEAKQRGRDRARGPDAAITLRRPPSG
jgi:diguanylate cyclase (GGDEF)-like protein